jgi:hypothetical protein
VKIGSILFCNILISLFSTIKELLFCFVKLINHIFTNKKYDILTKKYLIYDEHIGETMEQNHAPLDKNVIVCSESENECALVDLSILV